MDVREVLEVIPLFAGISLEAAALRHREVQRLVDTLQSVSSRIGASGECVDVGPSKKAGRRRSSALF